MPAVPGHPRIAIDADTCAGKPRIDGTRIPVHVILGTLAGSSVEWVLEGYPTLTREDIAAALRYAADTVIAQQAPVAAE